MLILFLKGADVIKINCFFPLPLMRNLTPRSCMWVPDVLESLL